MATFAERLRFLRTEKELTRKALSELTGVSDSSINMYERGEREPGLETLEAFADFFNVDMDYLLGRQEKQKLIDLSHLIPDKSNEDTSNLIKLTKHEHDVISAYRNHPDMQPAVDRLLGVEPEESKYIELVARGGKYKGKKDDAIEWAKQLDLDNYEEDHDLG